MITLERNEDIEIFQVELALKSKTKQSPFISILILTQEQKQVTAKTLQENLLTSLPVRACENLLKRLEQQGYLQKEQRNRLGGSQTYDDTSGNYFLTDLGQQSATDQSFWIGEKGVYNVFISNSKLFEQRIIKIEKVDRVEDDRNTNVSKTPNVIRLNEKQTLTINNSEVLIEDVEERCFQLKPKNCILNIRSKGNETVLKINHNNQVLFQTILEIEEDILQHELLLTCREFEYDENKKAILKEFSKDNVSFRRTIKILKPTFQRNLFNQVELENISHIPRDAQNAELWYLELLFRNINDYFLDENSFTEFASELSLPFRLNFKVQVPTRIELAKILTKRKNAFYQIAKLETIDYLNY